MYLQKFANKLHGKFMGRQNKHCKCILYPSNKTQKSINKIRNHNNQAKDPETKKMPKSSDMRQKVYKNITALILHWPSTAGLSLVIIHRAGISKSLRPTL